MNACHVTPMEGRKSRFCSLLQALLKKAGKPSVLGSLEENDPDAGNDDQDDDGEADKEAEPSSVVDKITDLLGKTGLTSK